MDETALPQLRMRHALLEIPVRRELPPGSLLRQAVPGDAQEIADLLMSAFGDPWDSGRVLRELFGDPEVPVVYVVERNGEIDATASYQVKLEPDPEAAWVHWVGVRPSARGLALGEIVSHRVLCEAIARSRSCVYLTTDDFRLPAIRTYLRLGFQPDCRHASDAARWEAVEAELAR